MYGVVKDSRWSRKLSTKASAEMSTIYPPGIPLEVCDKFIQLARKVKELHYRRYSADAILHQIRWFYTIEQKRAHFKINNNWSSLLARWAMDHHPDLQGFFETRVLKDQKVKIINSHWSDADVG